MERSAIRDRDVNETVQDFAASGLRWLIPSAG
jgi:hypothetical protein